MNTNERSHKARPLAKRIAKYMKSDEAFAETPKRWIWHESDFTEADKATIKEYTEKIIELFEATDGGKWSDVLRGFDSILPDFHFGFKAQETAIEMLTRYGYNFNL